MRCAPSIGGKQRKYSQFKSRNLLSERDSIKLTAFVIRIRHIIFWVPKFLK